MKTDFLPLDLYVTYLNTISGISFTRREIEIIAFLMSGRGVKTIASSLTIAPKTVEAHIHNVMLKLECNSRESIINFIEKSDKLSFIRRHYSNLLTALSFDQSLAEISKLNAGKFPSCLMISWRGENEIHPLMHQLGYHLKKAGVKISVEDRDNTQSIEELLLESSSEDFMIYCLPQALSQSLEQTISCPANVLFLLSENSSKEEPLQKRALDNFIDLSEQKNYYFMVFEILKKLLPHLDCDRIIASFTKATENTADFNDQNAGLLIEPQETLFPLEKELNEKHTEPFNTSLLFSFLKKHKWPLAGGSALMLVSLLILSLIETNHYLDKKSPEAQFMGSDLPIPALLNRPNLIQEIDKKLTGPGDIQTVALIGMGGSGKTTLARQYAHSQKPSVVWEMNAETRENLANSFEALAYALAKTDEEKKTLSDLKDIRNFEEREGKTIQLVRAQLKNHPNWLLIYDNVEKFSDIQKYFPSDANSWGTGKVIITTQDTHIQNNSYVTDALGVGELAPSEKLALFLKIMNHGGKTTIDGSQQESAKKFLDNLPSFPLDVSVAAYYMKATNINFNQYMKYLNGHNKDFSDIQKNVLKESSGYPKTRYHIIVLSLEKLIAEDKDFADLLLFTSLMDSQNIPRNLLDRYKGKLAVDKFIYCLKKYSLIMNPLSHSPSPLSHLSIHRSTQDIGFVYLTEFLKLKKDSKVLKDMTNALDDYTDQAIEQEDFSQMHVMAPHLEKVLYHTDVLTDFSKGLLESKLGSIYYFINDDKSREMLDDSLDNLQKKTLASLSPADTSRLARSFLHIGAVYTELRLYRRAEELFKKANNIYGKEGTKNYIELSWVLTHLGNIHRRLGNYEIAKDYLEQSVQLNKQYMGNKQRTARALGYLGSVYRGLGFYQKSINTLRESLAIYNKNYSNDHFRIGWTLTRLGNVYSDLGDFKKAKQYLEDGFLISKKYLPENHTSMGLTLTYLGNCYRELGDYEKSREFLEQSLKINKKHFDDNHRRIGWVLFHLANTYKALGHQQEAQKLFDNVLKIYTSYSDEGNIEAAHLLRDMAEIYFVKNQLDDAENLIKRSANILQDHNHVEAYKSLETLGDIYSKKSLQLSHVHNIQESQNLKLEALETFNQALKIAEKYFPNSIHIERIQSKIKTIEKEKIYPS